MATRRTMLGIMGLAGAAMPITGEAGARQLKGLNDEPSGYRFSSANSQEIALALHRLANDIEAGGSHVLRFELLSVAGVEEFLEHTMTMKFVVNENVSRNG